jgi:hypothetical protein
VPTPAPQPAVQAAGGRGGSTKVRERQTDLFRKMSGVRAPGDRRPPRGGSDRGGARGKGGSGPLIAIGAAVGAVGLIVILVVAMGTKQTRLEKEAIEKENRKKAVAEQNKKNAEEDRRLALKEEEDAKAAADAKKAGTKKASLVKKEGKYEAPAQFEPGARKVAEKMVAQFTTIELDANLKKEYEQLAAGGRVADIVKDDSKWIPYVIDGMLSDDEKVARASFQSLHDVCEKRKISSSEEGFRNPVKLEYVNSNYARAGEYNYWSGEWWAKGNNKDAVRSWAAGPAVAQRAIEDPARVNWDDLMKDLRAGGGYDDPKRPEGLAFSRVQGMGRGAYAYIVKYIDHEDPLMGRAAVAVLNVLTNRSSPLPTDANKAQIKNEWESWIQKN